MANKNNYQRFSQIDYCICQYFSKYMASTIVQEMSRQSSAQTLDDMMKRCTGRWEKDSRWKNDTQHFVDAFYNCLVAKNGGKPSKELRQYAQAYVYDRYESLTVEQLAREKVPKNSAEYIAKKAYSESLIGFGIHAVSKTDRLGDKVKEKAEELYQPSVTEKAFGYVGSALIDTATTGGLGGAATAVTKGVAVAGAKMATKATVKNMSKAVAADLAVRGVIHGADKGLDAILDEDSYGKLVFGDKDAIKKIQAGSLAYKKNGTEYIHSINNSLDRKIKAPSLSMTEQARKERSCPSGRA